MDNLLNSKNEGQVFSPEEIVILILNEVGYKDKKTLEKTIIEPSFGEGVFLIEIIKRIICESKKQEKNNQEIIEIIKRNVFGIEKDEILFKATIKRLNTLLKGYGLESIDWSNNLFNGDTIHIHVDFLNKFDYVVGNPPYIRIHNIDEETRAVIERFKFSNGNTDMYIMFYEMSIAMLNSNGKLGFITPNSFLKNTSQRKFRDYLINKKYISKIFDFKTSKIFKGVDVCPCICILNKNSKRNDKFIEYREYNMYKVLKKNNFSFEYFEIELKNKAWNLSSKEDILFLEQIKQSPIKIGAIATVQNSIVTNKNSVYISKAWIDKEETIPYMGKHTDKNKIVYFNGYPIESTILHRCIKASKYNGTIDNKYIIFPYKPNNKISFFVENKKMEIDYIPMTEKELANKFPNAYNYLIDNRQSLSTRDMEKGANWYQFGRSQGLQNSCYKKIVFKHIVNKEISTITPYIVDNDVIVYSGIYITVNIDDYIKPKIKNSSNNKISKQYDFNEEIYIKKLEDICKIIKNPDFARYCQLVGKNKLGGYSEISTKHIKEFGTNLSF